MEKEGAMCCRTRGRILYDESSKRFASNEHQESDGEHPGWGKLGGVNCHVGSCGRSGLKPYEIDAYNS